MAFIKRFTTIFLLLAIGLCQTSSAFSAAGPIHYFYAGPVGSVKTALALFSGFQEVADPAQADVFIFNGEVPREPAVMNRLKSGSGLLLILSQKVSGSDLSSFLGQPVTISQLATEVSPVQEASSSDPLTEQIIWTSAPQIKDRAQVMGGRIAEVVKGFEDGSLLVGSAVLGQGKIYLVPIYLEAQGNQQFQEWAYYNYLIYNLVIRLAGDTPLSFGQFPASPVPHPNERIIIFAVLAVLLSAALVAFWMVRRFSLAHPEALDTLLSNRQEYQVRQESTAWDEIGFHRPLGGFMLAFMLGVITFIPLIIYQNMILPAYILPSAQALGIWGRVTQFFQLLWQLFDLGTGAAFVKFFSEYRVHDPRKAIQYGQVFIWWQLLSGALQVAVVTTVASVIMPESPYALYAWSIIIHSVIQIPGFYGVMRLALNAYQRADYGQVVTLATEVLLPILIQPIFVTIMVAWGRSNPIFGPSMGGLLGLGISAYMVQLAAFLIGLWLYRRLGYNVHILFLAHFDWKIVKSAFKFGTFEMLGSAAWAAGQALEIVVTQARLVNYAEIWGNWGLAQNFIFSFQVVGSLYDNLMPSMSEAISNGKKILSKYYSVMAYKWGGMISAYIGAILLAVADRFILGASGPQFSRAAVYAIPLIIWGAIQYPSWVGDNVQLSANKPYLKTILVAGEQTIRITLAWILVDRFQVTGLIIAYFVGLLTKDIVSYFINHRTCFPQQFYFWQSLGAPLLAGAVHYAWLRWLTGFIWQGDEITSVLIFFIGILPSYPIFAFLYGIFGGWDNDTLQELRQSIEISSFMRPLAWLFWKSTAIGARLSPLHGRFPISIRSAALDEARSLMHERVRLS